MKILCWILGIVAFVETAILMWFAYRNKQRRTVGDIIEYFRNFWTKFVMYVLATSVIGLFLGSIFFEQIIGLDEINSWVGIVLGLVALIIGIISLWLSFYNVEQSNEVQKETVRIMTDVKGDIEFRLNEMDKTIGEGFRRLHDDFYAYVGNDNTKVITAEKSAKKEDWERT